MDMDMNEEVSHAHLIAVGMPMGLGRALSQLCICQVAKAKDDREVSLVRVEDLDLILGDIGWSGDIGVIDDCRLSALRIVNSLGTYNRH